MACRWRSLQCVLLILITSVACKTDTTGPEPLPVEEIPKISILTDGQEIVDEPKIMATMNVTVAEEMIFTGTIGIELRGSTSQRLLIRNPSQLKPGMKMAMILM